LSNGAVVNLPPPPPPPRPDRLAGRRGGLEIAAKASGLAGLCLLAVSCASLFHEVTDIRCPCRLGLTFGVIGAAAGTYAVSGLLFAASGGWRRGMAIAAPGVLAATLLALLAHGTEYDSSRMLLLASLVAAAVTTVRVTLGGWLSPGDRRKGV